MAKSSSFFGMRRGSTKAHTFSVYRGSQITKDRVTEITNPQTTKQMQQRVKMPLVAAARSTLAGLVNHSFQGVDYGWQSKAKFSKLNLENLDILSFGAKGIRTTGIANYQISEGSLIAPLIASAETSTQDYDYRVILNASEASTKAATSLNDVIDMILAGSNDLKSGDQLTFVSAYYDINSPLYIKDTTRFAVAQPTWTYYRLVLSHDAEQNKDIVFDGDLDDEGSAQLIFGDTFVLGLKKTASASGQLDLKYNLRQTAQKRYSAMFTVIVSRYDDTNKVWQRSTNRMTVFERLTNNEEEYAGKDYIVSQSQAIETYLKGTSSSSDYYLNEGGTSA